MEKKRPHRLHTCTSADAFPAAFCDETGHSIYDVVARFCGGAVPCGVVLGGSIPLGLGSPASDVDLLILLDPPSTTGNGTAGNGVPALPQQDPRTGVVFSATFASDGGTRLASGEVVAMMGGVEVNGQLLSAVAVGELIRRGVGARVSLTAHEIGLLSRLKTGWTLLRGPSFDRHCGALLSGNALEIHAVTWYLVGAVQELEDARAAVADSPMLALHLGRSCAERCVLAYFASRGFAYLGSKWLRALEPDSPAHRLRALADGIPGGFAALELMFPARDDAAEAYLDRVAALVATTRQVIEQDRAFRIAFSLCPQLRSRPP